MVPLPMTSQIQNLVLHIPPASTVETPHVVFELLPLRPAGAVLGICGVGAVDEAKVGG